MPAFTPPPPAPQRGDRATFSARVDAFLTWLVQLIPQLSAFAANLSALVAGGANSFVYTFSGDTADTDPGMGFFRFSSFPQRGAGVLRVDNQAVNGSDVTGFIALLAAGTSNIKGSVRIQKVNDISTWLVADISAVAGSGGYRNMAISVRGSSSQNPFNDGDQVVLFFDLKGDKGDGGGTPTQQQIRDAIGTLPVESGGTGSTNAVQGLANLGGFAKTGGEITGPLILNNGTPIQAKDSGGVTRNLIYLDDQNNVNAFNSGGNWYRIWNSSFGTVLWGIDNNGNTNQYGDFTFSRNNSVIYGKDASGNNRRILQLASDNNTYFGNGGGQNIYFTNQAGAAVATLTNAGVFSAFKLSATSDETEKENWRDLPDNFLEEFAAIERAGLFDWSATGETDGGIGAQSVQRIAPWCVFEDGKGKLCVNHSALNTVVTHALTRRVLRNEAMQ